MNRLLLTATLSVAATIVAAPTIFPAPVAAAVVVEDADQSSPVAAAASFFNAMFAGDEEAMQSMIRLETDKEKQAFDLMKPMLAASGKLMSTCQEKFGKAPVGRTTTDLDAVKEAIASATAEEDGDTATVTLTLPDDVAGISGTSTMPPMSMVKVDGQWMLADGKAFGMDAFTQDQMGPGEMEMLTATIGALEEVATAMTAEVEAGKFDSAEAVSAEMNQRAMKAMQEAMMGGQGGM